MISGLTLVVCLAAGSLLAACDSSASSSAAPSSPPTTQPSSTSPSPLPKQTLTFGVVGSADEVASYRQMASLFAPLNREVKVRVVSWPDEAAMMADLRSGAAQPDVFIASRRNLLELTRLQLIQPIDGLLDDRGVDFGDDYPRGTLTAFGSDNRLNCLPYGIAPSVMFYNKRLVKLGQVAPDPPVPGEGWSMDQFAAATRWAVRHHPHAAGAYVEPSLGGVAPFVLSGGGSLFDGADPPTSLTLSDTASQQALVRTVRLMHRPGVSLTPQQLAAKTPLQWFEDGRLAFLEGSRSIVPALRSQLGFDFDVMPMPVLESPATVGGLTGLCISSQATDAGTAADFLVYASTPEALGSVASAGYLQPANQTVALSDDFQQPGRLPQHASVFTFSVKSMQFPPLIDRWDELDAAIGPTLFRMMHGLAIQVPPRTREVDRLSQRVLRVEPSASPSGSGQSSSSSGG